MGPKKVHSKAGAEKKRRPLTLDIKREVIEEHAQVSMFGPLTTPEQQMSKTSSSSSLSQRMRSATLGVLTPKFSSKSKSAVSFNRQGNFFPSPLLE